MRIEAVVGTRKLPIVLSHFSAARLWNLPIVSQWPAIVHVTVPAGSTRRSKNGVLVHRHEGEIRAAEREGMLVTTPSRTLVDLARTAPLRDSVAALDHALANQLVTREELYLELEDVPLKAGRVRGFKAIEFASPLANRPGESYSRVLMHELGFPAPELQHEFVSKTGGRRFGDFWWPEIRALGEFDGRAKYFDPSVTGGKSPQDVFWEEKLRENELREHDTKIARWTWTDLDAVHPFVQRLESVGLRRVRGRGFA